MASKAPPITTIPLEVRQQIYFNLQPELDKFCRFLLPGCIITDFKNLAESSRFFYDEVLDYYFQHITFETGFQYSPIRFPEDKLPIKPLKTLSRLQKLQITMKFHSGSESELEYVQSRLEGFLQRLRTAKVDCAGQLLKRLLVSFHRDRIVDKNMFTITNIENVCVDYSIYMILLDEIKGEVENFSVEEHVDTTEIRSY